MGLSSTNRYLVGKKLPNHDSAVKMVTKSNGTRTVHLANGKKITMTARQLKNQFNSVLQTNQKKAAMRTVRTGPNNTTLVKLGGAVKGVVKKYKSLPLAKRAINRRYPKAK